MKSALFKVELAKDMEVYLCSEINKRLMELVKTQLGYLNDRWDGDH